MKPYYQESGIEIYLGDCREILPDLMALSGIDLVLTDPPYGIGYKSARGRRRADSSKLHTPYVGCQEFADIAGDDGPFDPSALLAFGRAIIWGGNHFASRLPDSGGWLVWDKKREHSKFIASDCELAWTNVGNMVKLFRYLWNGLCRQGEIGEHFHPTQKPLALMHWAIGQAGDCQRILDPYMGSGTSLVAAKHRGIRAIGIEIHEPYAEIAAKRLSQGVFNFESGELRAERE